MMSKLFAAIVIGAVAAFSSSAVVNESKTAELTDVESSYNFQPGDEYMPTLTELLGGPVDNLPEFTDEAILSGQIIDYAKQFIGTRYRSGAKGPSTVPVSQVTFSESLIIHSPLLREDRLHRVNASTSPMQSLVT